MSNTYFLVFVLFHLIYINCLDTKHFQSGNVLEIEYLFNILKENQTLLTVFYTSRFRNEAKVNKTEVSVKV